MLNIFSLHQIKLHLAFSLILVCVFFQTGCSTLPSEQHQQATNSDPLENVNRSIWDFNWHYADKYVLKPAAQVYVDYVNEDIRGGLLNMADNLEEPSSAINHLLQGKFSKAAISGGRFVVNSTVGLLGIFDVATHMDLPKHQESFGEVLGAYGVSDGPYLMLPVAGPSAFREQAGDLVDNYYWPLVALEFWPNLLRLGIQGLEARAALVEQEAMLNSATDSYEFVKSAYFQQMHYKVHDGNPPEAPDEEEDEALEAFLDEID